MKSAIRACASQRKVLRIMDIGGVIIPAKSTIRAIQLACAWQGVRASEPRIRKHIASSKFDHIRNIVRADLFGFIHHDSKDEINIIESILGRFQTEQMDLFMQDAEHSKLINPEALQNETIVLTSMFPKKIVSHLLGKFKNQGFIPYMCYSSSKFATRTEMVLDAMSKFPAFEAFFYVDTVADIEETSKIPNLKTIGMIGCLGAEDQFELAKRFMKAGAFATMTHTTHWEHAHI